MSYELLFLPSALKEWNKLDDSVRKQFKKKLAERLRTPKVPAAKLRNLKDHYKIKLRNLGYRLVYCVNDKQITVTVVVIDKREGGRVYDIAKIRHKH